MFFNGLNGKCYVLLLNNDKTDGQSYIYMSIVIVDVFVDVGIVFRIIMFILFQCSFLVNVIQVCFVYQYFDVLYFGQ